MSNWIDEAKKQAEEQRQREILRFHEVVDNQINEIELVLDETRRQGLMVSKAEEGSFSVNQYDQLTFNSEYFGYDHIGSLGDCLIQRQYSDHSSWSIIWTIRVPAQSGQKMAVLLGIKNGKCTITALEVEKGIKAWLLEIFSNQK